MTAFARSIRYALRVLDLILRCSLRGAYYNIVRALQDIVREEATDEPVGHVGPSFLDCVAAIQGAGANLRLVHVLGFLREINVVSEGEYSLQ